MNKCECPETGNVPEYRQSLYSEAEKPGMNHAPGKCKCVNRMAKYKRKDKELWLCSCCVLMGDVPVVERTT